MGSGTTPSSSTASFYNEGTIPWINTGDLPDGPVLENKQNITDYALIKYPLLKRYPTNTLLIAMYGATIGKLGMLTYPATVNQACCSLQLSEKQIYNKYLFYYLLNEKQNIISHSVGATQPNISQKIISFFPIIYPSLSEQIAIADYLDKKTTQIAAQIKLLETKRDTYLRLKKSLINKAVTKGLNPDVELEESGIDWLGKKPKHWKVKRIKDIATIKNGSDYKTIQADEGYPVIGSGGQFTYATDYIYDGEAVLLGRKGTIDKPLYVNCKFWVVDTMFYLIANKNASTRYLFYTALLIPYKSYSTSTALPSMTQRDLNHHLFPVPPLSEQQEIADYLDQQSRKIDDIVSNINLQIGKLQTLRKSLINEVITGERSIV